MKNVLANIIKNGRISQRDRPLSNEKTISYGKDTKNDRISQHGRFSLNPITYILFDANINKTGGFRNRPVSKHNQL